MGRLATNQRRLLAMLPCLQRLACNSRSDIAYPYGPRCVRKNDCFCGMPEDAVVSAVIYCLRRYRRGLLDIYPDHLQTLF